MPATNISQLLNFEAAIEPAIGEQLASAGVPNHLPKSQEDLPEYFALPMFIKGAGSSQHLHRIPVAAGGGWEYDIFEGCLVQVELFAPRIPNCPQEVILGAYDQLATLAIRARYAFRFNARPELNDRLPFHTFTHLVPLPDERGFDEDRGFDRHQLTWRCTVGIRKDAWPTTAAGYVLASGQ